MPNIKNLTLAVGFLVLAFGQAATAEWLHYANDVTQAQSASQKHNRALTLWATVPTEIADPTLCAFYESNHPKGNKGKVASRARIERADGSPTEMVEFGGEVTSNMYLDCRQVTAPIAAGDQVTFDFSFGKFARQRMKNDRSDFYSVNGVVSNFGMPSARAIPPGINPPPSGGRLRAATSMFVSERNRQRHPKELTQSLVMARDAANPVICAALGNVSHKPNKGRIITDVTILHQDGSETNMSFDGRVVNGIYAQCLPGPSLAAGDIVTYYHRFKGLPRLMFGGGFFDPVATYGIVSPDGIPMVRAGR